MPTASRTTRGREGERLCRAGCQRPETLNHVTQVCHRTHGARIKRHDAIVDYIRRQVEKKGGVAIIEPKVQTDQGVRKPDIIAARGTTVNVIDVQVVGGGDLDECHERKKQYYAGNSSLIDQLHRRFNTTEISFHTVTVSSRGVWSRKSAEDLLAAGIITKRHLFVVSSRAVIGSIYAFHVFNRMTGMKYYREERRTQV